MKMKYLIIIILISITYTVNAQSFKITDIETSNEKNYQKIAKEALGATILITFYDKTVSISLKGEDKPFILKRVREDFYSMNEQSGNAVTNYQLSFIRSTGKITKLRFSSINSINRMVFIAKLMN